MNYLKYTPRPGWRLFVLIYIEMHDIRFLAKYQSWNHPFTREESDLNSNLNPLIRIWELGSKDKFSLKQSQEVNNPTEQPTSCFSINAKIQDSLDMNINAENKWQVS